MYSWHTRKKGWIGAGLDPRQHAVVAEWLRRLTRNQFRSAGVGSNPTDRESFSANLVRYFDLLCLFVENLQNWLHRPGIEPGPPAWQASILPLNQRCSLTDWSVVNQLIINHHNPLANGQAVFLLTGQLEVLPCISEQINLASVTDYSVRYQAVNNVKRWKPYDLVHYTSICKRASLVQW